MNCTEMVQLVEHCPSKYESFRFDIVGLDCFLLTKTCFFQHYSPETEGCAGWQDFGYNRRQQLRQIIMIPIGCVVMALIFTRLG